MGRHGGCKYAEGSEGHRSTGWDLRGSGRIGQAAPLGAWVYADRGRFETCLKSRRGVKALMHGQRPAALLAYIPGTCSLNLPRWSWHADMPRSWRSGPAGSANRPMPVSAMNPAITLPPGFGTNLQRRQRGGSPPGPKRLAMLPNCSWLPRAVGFRSVHQVPRPARTLLSEGTRTLNNWSTTELNASMRRMAGNRRRVMIRREIRRKIGRLSTSR